MGNPELRARLKPKEWARHNRLKAHFGLNGTYQEDHDTLVMAEELAEKHIKLLEKIKEFDKTFFGGLFEKS